MGHKVSPKAFRIPYISTWSANWYATKGDYVQKLKQDNTIQAILKKEFRDVPVGDILIARNDQDILVTIYSAKAALVLGKDDENLIRLQELLSKKAQGSVKIDVKEIKNPDLNAKVVAFMISNQIEKRMPYKRAIKQAIAKTMEKGAKGIKVKVGGRLNGVDIARKETFKKGNTPAQTIRADIDYTTQRAETVYGTIGIKVWIYKGDIYKKK